MDDYNVLNEQYALNIYDAEAVGRWVCDNDSKADWCVRKIEDARLEHERITAGIIEQMQLLEDRLGAEKRVLERTESTFLGKLREYWENGVEGQPSETQTQFKYRLPSGNVVWKKEKQSIVKADDAEQHAPAEFIEQVPKLKWGEWKKELAILGGKVIDRRTGEVVEGVTIERKPGRLEVKI